MTTEDILNVVLAAAGEVFHREVHAEHSFLGLHGGSLQAVALAVRIEEALGREIDLSDLFDADSFSEFSALIDK